MATIDVTSIEGYSEMSAEEKLKVLESYEIAEPDYSGYVKKDLFDKTASELSDKNKKLKELMSADEAEKLEQEKAQSELQAKYDTLLEEMNISKNKSKFLALGYDEKLADESAAALVKGDLPTLFENQKKHLTAFEKQLKAELLKDTPKPVGEDQPVGFTKDDIKKKMSFNERAKFSQDHSEEYQEIYNNKGG